ncbi:hypothetical protein RCL1_001618 [Eukaryota sp. TZLM3-RCL]
MLSNFVSPLLKTSSNVSPDHLILLEEHLEAFPLSISNQDRQLGIQLWNVCVQHPDNIKKSIEGCRLRECAFFIIEKSASRSEDPLFLAKFASKMGKLWADVSHPEHCLKYFNQTLQLVKSTNNINMDCFKLLFNTYCWFLEYSHASKNYDQMSQCLVELAATIKNFLSSTQCTDISTEQLFLTSLVYNFAIELNKEANYKICADLLEKSQVLSWIIEPQRSSLLFKLLASCKYSLGSHEEALQAVEMSLSLNRTASSLLLHMKILYALDKHNFAADALMEIFDLTTSVDAASNSLDLLLAGAELSIANNDFTTAEKVVSMFYDRQSDSTRVRGFLTSVYLKSGKTNSALAFVDRIITRGSLPSDDPLHNLLWREAANCSRSGQSVLTVEWLKRALQALPETDTEGKCRLLRSMCRALLDQGEIQEALVHAKTADSFKPGVSETLFLLVLIYFNLGDYDEASQNIVKLKNLATTSKQSTEGEEQQTSAELLLAATAQELWKHRNTKTSDPKSVTVSYTAITCFLDVLGLGNDVPSLESIGDVDVSCLYRHLFTVCMNILDLEIARELIERFSREVTMENARIWKKPSHSRNGDPLIDRIWFIGTLWNIGTKLYTQDKINQDAISTSLKFLSVCLQLVQEVDKKGVIDNRLADLSLHSGVLEVTKTISSVTVACAISSILLDQTRTHLDSGSDNTNIHLDQSSKKYLEECIRVLDSVDQLKVTSLLENNSPNTQAVLNRVEAILLLRDENSEKIVEKFITIHPQFGPEIFSIMNSKFLKCISTQFIKKMLEKWMSIDHPVEVKKHEPVVLKQLIELSTSRDEAKKFYQMALEIAQEMTTEERQWFASSSWNNGVFYTRMTDYAKAENWVAQSLQFLEVESIRKAYDEILKLKSVELI